MTIIYVTEYNNRCYGVNSQYNGWIKVQNFKDISNDKNTIYCVKSLEIFLGKSESCLMTVIWGSFNKNVFDGNTFLLRVSEKIDENKFLYVGGDMVRSFLTNDKIYEYISNMGNNLIPYSIAIGEENIYFLTPHFEYFKRENIKKIELMEMKSSLICLIMMFQIVEKTRLKN